MFLNTQFIVALKVLEDVKAVVTIDGMWRSPTTVGGLLFYFSEVLRITPESLKHSTISSYQQRTIISVEGTRIPSKLERLHTTTPLGYI